MDAGKTHETFISQDNLSIFRIYLYIVDRAYAGTNSTLGAAVFHVDIILNPFANDMDF